MVLAATNAADLMIQNDDDIMEYTEEIATMELELASKQGALEVLLEGAAVTVGAQEEIVLDKETTYIEKRTAFDRVSEDNSELVFDCKIEAFHENQTQLEELRDTLRLYGIIVDTGLSADEEFGPGGFVTGGTGTGNGWDCRYRQIQQCQGEVLKRMNEEQLS